MILGDLGAEIIKVEVSRQGDDARQWGPPHLGGEATYFLSANRNKKSVTLNLKNPRGKEIILKLVEKCDILLENFRPGTMVRLGLEYEMVKKANPKIIYCSISGFGQDGPYRNRLAYDIVLQGMGGLMGITGEPNRSPVRIGIAITDIVAGMYAAIAILSSLRFRDRVGRGQRIDISLLDSTVSLMTYAAMSYFATGEIPQRLGSAHPTVVPYQAFKTKDGKYITIAAGNDKFFEILCKVAGLDKLEKNPRFATNTKRVQNRDELISVLEQAFLKKTRDEWLKDLIEKGFPCGPVYAMDEVFSDSQIIFRNMVTEVEHLTARKIRMISNPIKFSNEKWEVKLPPGQTCCNSAWSNSVRLYGLPNISGAFNTTDNRG